MMDQLQFDFDKAPKAPITETAFDRMMGSLCGRTREDLDLFQRCLCGSHGEDLEVIADQALILACTVIRKNMDYGSSVFQTPVLAPDMDVDAGIRVRMSDKIQRMVNLMDGEGAVDESLMDTMGDLAGYAMLWMVAQKMGYGESPKNQGKNASVAK